MAPTSRIADLPQSLADADNFPCNIVDKQTYIATLAAYRDRLGSIAGNLCYESESDAVVYFRDFDPGHGDHTQQRCSGITLTMVDPAHPDENVWSLSELHQHLGILPAIAAAPSLPIVSKPDPKCRFM
jgi:hypothetical protein